MCRFPPAEQSDHPVSSFVLHYCSRTISKQFSRFLHYRRCRKPHCYDRIGTERLCFVYHPVYRLLPRFGEHLGIFYNLTPDDVPKRRKNIPSYKRALTVFPLTSPSTFTIFFPGTSSDLTIIILEPLFLHLLSLHIFVPVNLILVIPLSNDRDNEQYHTDKHKDNS